MKYKITGTFLNGEIWAEDAQNLSEAHFTLNKIYRNGSVNQGSVRIFNKCVDVTDIVLRKLYGEIDFI